MMRKIDPNPNIKNPKNTTIPNITKISISVILIAYVLGRGILLPIKKGINLIFLFRDVY